MTRKGTHDRDAEPADRRHPAGRCTRSSSTTATSSSSRTSAACTSREGQFVMNRPIVGPLNNTGIDESTDAYDTIDWLVKNVPESNGRVGTIGSSYLGFTDAGGGDQPAPGAQGRGAAKPDGRRLDGRRLVPQRRVPHRQLRLCRVDRAPARPTAARASRVGPGDDYTRYLEAGSMADLRAQAGTSSNVPFVQKLMQNPAYTEFWSAAGGRQMVGGASADRPDDARGRASGTRRTATARPRSTSALKDKYEGSGLLHLVIGPWRHSGANHYGYELGDLTFTGDTAREWRTQYLKPFLDHYLKGAPDPHTPDGADLRDRHQQMGGEPALADGHADAALSDGGNGVELRPPCGGRARRLCLRPGQARAVPAAADQHGRRRPVAQLAGPRPALRRRPAGRAQLHERAADQAGAHHGRAASRPVRRDQRHRQRLGGEADRRLSQRQSGRRVAGRRSRTCRAIELPIGIEIFRGRYVDSFAQAAGAAAPARSSNISGACPTSNHVFLPGHRIMVQVQSSLFPLYDRNPQTFVPEHLLREGGRLPEGDAERIPRRGDRERGLLPVVPN